MLRRTGMSGRTFAAVAVIVALGTLGSDTASAQDDGLDLDSILPLPIPPLTYRNIDVTGTLTCIEPDYRPGTRTTVNLTASAQWLREWEIAFLLPEVKLYLDSARCSDPAYAVPFSAIVSVRPTLNAEPSRPYELEIVARVEKTNQNTGELLGFASQTTTNLTLVTEEFLVFDVTNHFTSWPQHRVHSSGERLLRFGVHNQGNTPLIVDSTVRGDAPLDASIHIRTDGEKILGTSFERNQSRPSFSTYAIWFHAPPVREETEFDFDVVLHARSQASGNSASKEFTFPVSIVVKPTEGAPAPTFVVIAAAIGLSAFLVAQQRQRFR